MQMSEISRIILGILAVVGVFILACVFTAAGLCILL